MAIGKRLKTLPMFTQELISMDQTFQVKDLYLAGYLYANGQKFRGVRRDGPTCWFEFENRNECLKMQQDYFSGLGNTNPKTYADALKTLKGVIFDFT